MSSIAPGKTLRVRMRDGMDDAYDAPVSVIRSLGVGGMAEVHLVDRGSKISEGQDRHVAMKLLSETLLAKGGRESGRFFREIEVMRVFSHPNIARFVDWGTLNGIPFYFSEFIDGCVVSNLIDGAAQAAGFRVDLEDGQWRPATLEERPEKLSETAVHVTNVLIVMRGILSALIYLHSKGIVHRDLKPDNVMVLFDTDGRIKDVKVLDFGIAKFLDPTRTKFTQTGTLLGTCAFMAPEQIADSKEVNGRTDIYAAGLMMLSLLTGRTLMATDSQPMVTFCVARTMRKEVSFDPALYVSDLPESIRQVVVRATQFSPDDRYQSALEMLTALEEAYGCRSPELYSGDTLERIPVPEELSIGSLSTQLGEPMEVMKPMELHPEGYGVIKAVRGFLSSTLTFLAVMVTLSIAGYVVYLMATRESPSVLAENAKSIATSALRFVEDAGTNSTSATSSSRVSSVQSNALVPEVSTSNVPITLKMNETQIAVYQAAGKLMHKGSVNKALGIFLRLEKDGVRDPLLLNAIAIAYHKKGDTKNEIAYKARASGFNGDQ